MNRRITSSKTAAYQKNVQIMNIDIFIWSNINRRQFFESDSELLFMKILMVFKLWTDRPDILWLFY